MSNIKCNSPTHTIGHPINGLAARQSGIRYQAGFLVVCWWASKVNFWSHLNPLQKPRKSSLKKTVKFCCYSTAFFAQNTFFPKNGYLCIEDNQTFSIYALAWLLVDSQQVRQLKISNRLSTAFWAVWRSSFLGQTLLISNTGLTLLPSFKHCGTTRIAHCGASCGAIRRSDKFSGCCYLVLWGHLGGSSTQRFSVQRSHQHVELGWPPRQPLSWTSFSSSFLLRFQALRYHHYHQSRSCLMTFTN